jgi:hypothetical protein
MSVSGPEGKGLAQYAEGLASTTYQQQFQNYWSQLNNIYNMLSGASAAGANAAAGVGQAGTATAQAAANALQTGAAGTAAGQIQAANALGGIGSNLGTVAQNYALNNAFFGQQAANTNFAQGGSPGLTVASLGQPGVTTDPTFAGG